MVKTRLLYLLIALLAVIPAVAWAAPRHAPPAYADGVHSELQVAAWLGDVDRVRLRLESGDGVDEADSRNGATPLMLAAAGGHSAVMDVLLNHGADLSRTSIDKCTILDWASPNLFPEVLERFLRNDELFARLRKADIDRVFHRAVALRLELDVLMSLLDAGADPDVSVPIQANFRDELHHPDRRDLIPLRNAKGKRPIHLAFQQDRRDLIRELLSRGIDVDLPDSHGMTSVHWAALSGEVPLLRMVVAEAKQVDLLDREGRSAAQLALDAPETLEDSLILLREGGADLSRPARRGISIFTYGARHLSAAAVRRLADSGLVLGASHSEVNWLFREIPTQGDLDLFGAVVDAMGDRVTHQNLLRLTILHADEFEEGSDTLREFLFGKGVGIEDVDLFSRKSPLAWAYILASPKRTELALALGIDPGVNVGSEHYPKRTITKAAKSGHIGAIELLLHAGQSPLRSDHDWPLFVAMHAGRADVTRLLLSAGADVELHDVRGGLLSDIGVHWDVLRVMVDFGFDIDTPINGNRTLLHQAAWFAESRRRDVLRASDSEDRLQRAEERYQHAIEFMEVLVELGADPNHFLTPHGSPILMHISDVEVVRELVELGASLEQRDSHGNTALVREVLSCREHVTDKLRYLCEETDQINLTGARGLTPLRAAAMVSGVEVLEYLITEGADTAALADDGRGVLEMAMEAYSGAAETSRFASSLPQSPHRAMYEDTAQMRLQVVEYLIEKGVPLGKSDSDGRTALHRPLEPNMIRALVDLGADVNARTADNGDTPLIAAARRLDAPAIEILLDSGAKPRIKNHARMMAIDVIARPPLPEWKLKMRTLVPLDAELYERVYERLREASHAPGTRG